MIFPEENIGYVHIPKNAGTSIERWLIEYANANQKEIIFTKSQHSFSEDVTQYQENYFTIIRNPYSRICSYYEFAKRRIEFWEPNGFKHNEPFPSLFEFIERTHNLKEVHLSQNGEVANYMITSNQVEWIRSGNPILISYENINVEFNKIKEHFNWYRELPVINASTKRSYRSYYNTKTRKLVEKIFQEDFDTFKYTW
jgi:hypothetical protein